MSNLPAPTDSAPPAHGRIPVTVTERHAHLTEDAIACLFGDRWGRLSRDPVPASATVTLVGPRGRIPHVRVVGPAREDNQIEISQSDAQLLGMRVPVRESGDLRDSPGLFIEGPRSSVRLDHGVIRTLRHIHMDPADAARQGVRDGDRTDLVREGAHPHTLFCDVLIRVSPGFRTELHLDADESQAAGLHSGCYVALEPLPR